MMERPTARPGARPGVGRSFAQPPAGADPGGLRRRGRRCGARSWAEARGRRALSRSTFRRRSMRSRRRRASRSPSSTRTTTSSSSTSPRASSSIPARATRPARLSMRSSPIAARVLSGIGGVKRPGIVHRLDKDTSGLLVVAKNDFAHQGLAAQFADHGRTGPLERAYLALVWGAPARPKGDYRGAARAQLPQSREDRRGQRRTAASRSPAMRSRRRLRPPPASRSRASCAASLQTGRTHQIRVHMAHIGHPLLGDALYGARLQDQGQPARGRAAGGPAGARPPGPARRRSSVSSIPGPKKPCVSRARCPADMAALLASAAEALAIERQCAARRVPCGTAQRAAR